MPDERGLYLLVLPSGHRSWRMGYWFAGEKKRLVLGAYPEMSLQAARRARDEARDLVAQGIDPAVHRKQQEARRLLNTVATFEAIARQWLGERMPGWSGSYARTTLRLFENHLFKQWGSLPIGQITKPMVAKRMKEIEARGTVETAHRARQKAAEIFDYAEALGYEFVNPSKVAAALRPVVQQPMPAITDIEALRRMLMAIEKAPAHPITKLCSRFIALTAVRPGVAHNTPWTEFDKLEPDAPVWIVPAARMKLSQPRKKQAAFDHSVPLARQTVELLETLRVLTGRWAYAFPGIHAPRKAISDSTVSKLYRDNGYRDIHVPHGWRSSFSTIMNERAMLADRPGDRIVLDLMLGHLQDGIEPKYNRAAYMPRRRQLAQEWADLLLEGLPPASHLLSGPRN